MKDKHCPSEAVNETAPPQLDPMVQLKAFDGRWLRWFLRNVDTFVGLMDAPTRIINEPTYVGKWDIGHEEGRPIALLLDTDNPFHLNAAEMSILSVEEEAAFSALVTEKALDPAKLLKWLEFAKRVWDFISNFL